MVLPRGNQATSLCSSQACKPSPWSIRRGYQCEQKTDLLAVVQCQAHLGTCQVVGEAAVHGVITSLGYRKAQVRWYRSSRSTHWDHHYLGRFFACVVALSLAGSSKQERRVRISAERGRSNLDIETPTHPQHLPDLKITSHAKCLCSTSRTTPSTACSSTCQCIETSASHVDRLPCLQT